MAYPDSEIATDGSCCNATGPKTLADWLDMTCVPAINSCRFAGVGVENSTPILGGQMGRTTLLEVVCEGPVLGGRQGGPDGTGEEGF